MPWLGLSFWCKIQVSLHTDLGRKCLEQGIKVPKVDINKSNETGTFRTSGSTRGLISILRSLDAAIASCRASVTKMD